MALRRRSRSRSEARWNIATNGVLFAARASSRSGVCHVDASCDDANIQFNAILSRAYFINPARRQATDQGPSARRKSEVVVDLLRAFATKRSALETSPAA